MTDTDPTQQYGAGKSNNETQQPIEAYTQILNNQTGKMEVFPILLPKPYMGNNSAIPYHNNSTLNTNLVISNSAPVQKKKKSFLEKLFSLVGK